MVAMATCSKQRKELAAFSNAWEKVEHARMQEYRQIYMIMLFLLF